MNAVRPMPSIDLDSAAWWDALQRHELNVQRCSSCGRLRWPARAMCNQCGSFDSTWTSAQGTGVVISWTVTYHSFGPSVDVPFLVALVRLDDQDDICIPGYVDAPSDGSTMTMGLRVHTGFETVDIADGQQLVVLRWQPVKPSQGK